MNASLNNIFSKLAPTHRQIHTLFWKFQNDLPNEGDCGDWQVNCEAQKQRFYRKDTELLLLPMFFFFVHTRGSEQACADMVF